MAVQSQFLLVLDRSAVVARKGVWAVVDWEESWEEEEVVPLAAVWWPEEEEADSKAAADDLTKNSNWIQAEAAKGVPAVDLEEEDLEVWLSCFPARCVAAAEEAVRRQRGWRREPEAWPLRAAWKAVEAYLHRWR